MNWRKNQMKKLAKRVVFAALWVAIMLLLGQLAELKLNIEPEIGNEEGSTLGTTIKYVFSSIGILGAFLILWKYIRATFFGPQVPVRSDGESLDVQAIRAEVQNERRNPNARSFLLEEDNRNLTLNGITFRGKK